MKHLNEYNLIQEKLVDYGIDLKDYETYYDVASKLFNFIEENKKVLEAAGALKSIEAVNKKLNDFGKKIEDTPE
jgi:hypothetical protein